MKKPLIALCLVATAVGASWGAPTKILWKEAKDGELTVGTNWEGDVAPCSAEKPTEQILSTFDFADADLRLTLGESIWFNAFSFGKKGANSTYAFDLLGHTLSLTGLGNYAFEFVNGGAGTVVITNGTALFGGSSDRSVISIAQPGAHFTVGADATIDGFQAVVKSKGVIEVRDGGCWKGRIAVSSGARMTITGENSSFVGTGTMNANGTIKDKHYQIVGDQNAADAALEILDGAKMRNAFRLFCGANGYNSTISISNSTVEVANGGIVAGSAVSASNNTFFIGGGAHISNALNSDAKYDLIVGENGDGNRMFVAGEGTTVSNLGASHGVTVGARSSGNTLVVSDGAELSLPGDWLGVGAQDSNDSSRGPIEGAVNVIANNRVVVRDGGRIISGKGLVVGQESVRPNQDFKGVTCLFVSNVLEVADGGSVSLDSGSVGVASNMSYCAVRARGKGTSLTCGSFYLGTSGQFCELEVADGATAEFSSKFNIGGPTATGILVRVTGPGSVLNHTTSYVSWQSAADGGAGTTLEVSDGAVFRSGALIDSGRNLHVVVDNATIEVDKYDGYYPGYVEFKNGTEFTFAGESPTIRELDADRKNHLGFTGGETFNFRIPSGGYKTVPLDFSLCTNSVAFSGSPKATFDVERFAREGGGRVVLMAAGAGFGMQNDRMAENLASLSENLPQGCQLYFADDEDVETPVTAASKARRLVLKVPNRGGMMILLR